MPPKRAAYTSKFKLQVIKFAEESNNCTAGREFGVNEKLVRDWRKVKDVLEKMPRKMLEGEKTFTAGGNMQAASLPVVAEWVKSSWNEVGNDMVERSFKKCGISNAMNGTEDDLIYDADVFDRATPVVTTSCTMIPLTWKRCEICSTKAKRKRCFSVLTMKIKTNNNIYFIRYCNLCSCCDEIRIYFL